MLVRLFAAALIVYQTGIIHARYHTAVYVYEVQQQYCMNYCDDRQDFGSELLVLTILLIEHHHLM